MSVSHTFFRFSFASSSSALYPSFFFFFTTFRWLAFSDVEQRWMHSFSSSLFPHPICHSDIHHLVWLLVLFMWFCFSSFCTRTGFMKLNSLFVWDGYRFISVLTLNILPTNSGFQCMRYLWITFAPMSTSSHPFHPANSSSFHTSKNGQLSPFLNVS